MGKNVTDEKYKKRITICDKCPELGVDTCGVCGCNVTKKAKWSTEKCPLGKW